MYLGCKSSENLPLNCTNGHLILCWELHSHCLFCISILTFVTCLISWGSGQYHLEIFFFHLTKAGFHFPNFLFVTQTTVVVVVVIDRAEEKGQTQVLTSPHLSFVLMPDADAANDQNVSHCHWRRRWKARTFLFLMILYFSPWFTLLSATQTFPKTFQSERLSLYLIFSLVCNHSSWQSALRHWYIIPLWRHLSISLYFYHLCSHNLQNTFTSAKSLIN